MSDVWTDYLQDKKNARQKVKVYLNEKNQTIQNDPKTGVEIIKLNNIMLGGHIDCFDEKSLRLKDKECLIERSSVMSIKSE